MDLLTAKDLHQAEFREKFRGYDPEEVDSFLEQVAKGVDVLHQRLREAMDRAERAEVKARDVNESDDTLRRTLVLAQRTADAAINEAKERAAKLVTDAEDFSARTKAEAEARARRSDEEAALRSRRSMEEAETHSNRLIQEANAEARRGSDELRVRLRDEIAALESVRTRLAEDIGRLEGHLGTQRERVRSSVDALTFVLENPGALREIPVPEVAPVVIPTPVEGPATQGALPPPSPAGATAAGAAVAAGAAGAPAATEAVAETAEAADVDAGPPTQQTVIDLTAVDEAEGSASAPANPTPPAGTPVDEEMVNSFFEQGSYTDDRWKGSWRAQ